MMFFQRIPNIKAKLAGKIFDSLSFCGADWLQKIR
jgi:hypothetical protein